MTQPNPADLIRALGGEWPQPTRPAYVPSRFPYTYAYDFMRLCGGGESRAEAAGKLHRLADLQGIDREAAAHSLAFAYLRHEGITR